jgi:tetratricopeptide (TPR) repeat protein
MHVPVLSLLVTAVKWAWNKLRGRPTVQADQSDVVVGESQTINAPVAAGEGVVASDGSVVATGQATIITVPSGGPTIVVQPGAAVNFTFYVDGLPSASAPTRDHFLEGRRLQNDDHHEEAIGEFEAAFGGDDTEGQRAALHLLIGVSQAVRGHVPQAERSLREAGKLFMSVRDKQGEGAALRNLGLVYLTAAEFQQAEESLTKSLAIQRELGDRSGEADALDKLGLVHLLGALAAGKRMAGSAGDAVSTLDTQRTELETALECFGQAYRNKQGDRRSTG